MAFYITLTSPRTTAPDPVALLAAVKTSTGDATAVLIDPFRSGVWYGKKATAWTAQQIADAQTLLDTMAEQTPQLTAQREIDNWPIMFRALVLALIDELNILRTHAAIGLAPRTPAQAITAIRNKAGTL